MVMFFGAIESPIGSSPSFRYAAREIKPARQFAAEAASKVEDCPQTGRQKLPANRAPRQAPKVFRKSSLEIQSTGALPL